MHFCQGAHNGVTEASTLRFPECPQAVKEKDGDDGHRRHLRQPEAAVRRRTCLDDSSRRRRVLRHAPGQQQPGCAWLSRPRHVKKKPPPARGGRSVQSADRGKKARIHARCPDDPRRLVLFCFSFSRAGSLQRKALARCAGLVACHGTVLHGFIPSLPATARLSAFTTLRFTVPSFLHYTHPVLYIVPLILWF